MADQDGSSIMQKIQAITAPPHPSPTSKQRRGKTKPQNHAYYALRQSGVDNHPYCDACGDGGDLLCCEQCPASFHFVCCDPPLDPLHIPEGEWVCHSCRPSPTHMENQKNSLFGPLLIQAYSENPSVFTLPSDMMEMAVVKDVRQDRRNKADSSVNIYCYLCNRSSKTGSMISCDFCPLSYHLDCLDPPLTHYPISATWMCPNHIEHKISGLHKARLSERIKALEMCRADISRHSIKLDFLAKLRHIPHYKRITARTNRRATEVPAVIKALYSEPLQDSQHVTPVIDTLLTAAEHLEVLRKEGERERQDLELTHPPVLTQAQDEWTRHKVLEDIGFKRSTMDDLQEILQYDPPLCNGVKHDMVDGPILTNGGCDTEATPTPYLETKASPQTTSTQTSEPFKMETTPSQLFVTSPIQPTTIIPDINLLDDKLIRLLATQRIQQLLTSYHTKTLNGLKQDLPTTPTTSYSGKKRHRGQDPYSSLALLCPLSSYGPAVPLQTSVITIGAGSEMDVCLRNYGHCNYISSRHACLILDRETEEYELINYSEHGSIVDGVLYSCDFSDKSSSSEPPVLLLDDIVARGDGIRAANAKRRLEYARTNLQDKEKAKKVLSAALKMNKSINKDCSPDPTVLTNRTKRARSSETPTPSDLSSPSSSIVSIPLSKTRHTPPNNHNSIDIGSSPEKKIPLSQPTGGNLLSNKTNQPCLCKKSASSLIGTSGKGWEGAALVSHGSRLRFGCIQLVLSITDKPGHRELLHTLFDAHLL